MSPVNKIFSVVFIGIVIVSWKPVQSGETECALVTSAIQPPYLPTTGTTRALVIFIKFSDDFFTNVCPGTTDGWDPYTYDTTRPAWTDSIIDPVLMSPQTEGSLSDYFEKVSFGQFRMIGDVYPQDGLVYVPEHEQSYYYVSNGRGMSFLHEEILRNLDPVIDYSMYDTNPQDGVVDMIFMVYREFNMELVYLDPAGRSFSGISLLTPNTWFNQGGIDNFPLQLDGVTIEGGFPGSGVTLRHSYYLNDVRDLASHEFGHYWFGGTHFGDRLGWFGYSNGVAAGRGGFDKVRLGWVSPTRITSDTTGLVITDLNTDGRIYRIDIPGTSRYFLLENRQHVSYYEQQWVNHCGGTSGLPATGLLITHTSSDSPVHIEAADNNYVVPGDGGDTYKPGNKVQFTPWTQPNSDDYGSWTGRAVTNIRQSGTDMIVDIDLSFTSGQLSEDSWWQGSETITGDIEVSSGVSLTVGQGTTVTFSAGSDDQAGGTDPNKTELIINGTLQINGTSSQPVSLQSSSATPQAGDWYGIRFLSGSSGSVNYANVRHATKGIFVSSASPTLQNNTIEDFTEQGIYLYNALTGANDPPVQKNTIRHGGSAGIYVTGTTPPRAKIVSNTIDDVYVGIDFEGGNFDDVATIEGNFIGQNSGGSGQSIQTALKLNSGATVEVKDNYLENGYDENLRDVGSPLANIHNNALFYGLIGYHAADYTSASLADNYIAGNSAGAYISYWDATPNFDGGNNFENDDYNLSSESVWLIDAENNWWGSTDPSVIESKLSGQIDYEPYLTSPNPDAGPPGLFLSKGSAGLVRATERMMELDREIEQFALLPNHPNPFNPSTTIEFELPEAAEVRVVVYDLSGRPVRELTRGLFDPGRYTIDWDGRDRSGASVASGVYFYRLVAVPVGGGSTVVQTRKFTLLK